MTSRRARRRAPPRAGALSPHAAPPPSGGALRPLGPDDLEQIAAFAFEILETVGMGALPQDEFAGSMARGATRRADGRICFPRAVVQDALARAPRCVDLPGFAGDTPLRIGGVGVHIGTGGAAVQVLDAATGTHRDSTLRDLYTMMRVLEVAPHIHYGVRPLIARDLTDPWALDLNTAFACMKATAKPIGISFDSPDHVAPICEMFDMALGGPGAFAARPFCMAVIVHAVPPLSFAPEGVASLRAALQAGMIPQICSAGQAGATSPVTLAGALAQGLAECLAGLVLIDQIAPAAPAIYALMPFVSDLRTGAMTGGSGEGAIASAAAAQLLAHLGLPSTVSAGMTDAKIADAQAGYEKGYTVAMAAHAGADMINLSVGMLGSIMVGSPEALIIDDDMCGAILSSLRGIEVTPATLDIGAIERVVTGDGHYLGEAETLARMKSDYVYPALGDRQSVHDWTAAGARPIWDAARERVAQILAAPAATHLDPATEAHIRAAFPIHLPA